MVQRVLTILFISLLTAIYPRVGSSQAGSKNEPEILCPTFIFSHQLSPGLSDIEKNLVCGDPKESKTSNEGWRTIPSPQARFFLKNFLQDRGYLHPKFVENAEVGVNRVDLGELTRVTRLNVHGAPLNLDIARRRKILGEPLTPAILEVIQKWFIHNLQTVGYACPKITTTANPKTGEVDVYMAPGDIQNIVKVNEELISGLTPGVLRRYDAFNLGYPYDADLLSITETRIMSISLLEEIHFTSACESDGVHITQRVDAGKPSFLSLGVGVNTEGLLIGKGAWRNSRLGSKASWTDITLLASSQEQRLSSTFQWYFLPYPSRFFFRPLLEFRRQNETAFETGTIRAQFSPNTSWDSQYLSLTFSIGPNLELLRTFRGDGPTDSHYLSIETRLDVKTHDYEFYQTNPQSGFDLSFLSNISDANIYSQVSVQRYRIQAQGLWNFNNYDPPLLIFGFRSGVATLLTDQRPGSATLLPPNYLEYLGGSVDLRGFTRKELPFNGLGALSSFYTDFELRLGRELPYGLEPFIFTDFGLLGFKPLQLEMPVYWSPGFGIRWSSAIGVFRTTLAHGFAENTAGHFQFFLSYGEEF